MESSIDSFLHGLSEPDQVYLAQKVMKGLPVERKAKLLYKLLSDSGLVVMMGGSNPFFHSEALSSSLRAFDTQNIANVALPTQDIASAALPNLSREIQSNNVDLAAVIEAVVMARRSK